MSESYHRQMPARQLFKRFLPYFGRYKAALIFDLFCAALTTVCEIVFPLIIREITNRAMVAPNTLTIPWVLRLGALYLLLRVIDTLGAYYMQSRGHFMGAKIETDMRRDLFSHIERLSFAYYNNTNRRIRAPLSGGILHRGGQDRRVIRDPAEYARRADALGVCHGTADDHPPSSFQPADARSFQGMPP